MFLATTTRHIRLGTMVPSAQFADTAAPPRPELNPAHLMDSFSAAITEARRCQGGLGTRDLDSEPIMVVAPSHDLPPGYVAPNANTGKMTACWMADVSSVDEIATIQARISTALRVKWNLHPFHPTNMWCGPGFCLSLFSAVENPSMKSVPTFVLATLSLEHISKFSLFAVAYACACAVYRSRAFIVGTAPVPAAVMESAAPVPEGLTPLNLSFLDDEPEDSLLSPLQRHLANVAKICTPPPIAHIEDVPQAAPEPLSVDEPIPPSAERLARIVSTGIAQPRLCDGVAAAFVVLRYDAQNTVVLFTEAPRPYSALLIPNAPYCSDIVDMDRMRLLVESLDGSSIYSRRGDNKQHVSARYPPEFSIVRVHMSTGSRGDPVLGIRVRCTNEATLVMIRMALRDMDVSADLADYRAPSIDSLLNSADSAVVEGRIVPPYGTVVTLKLPDDISAAIQPGETFIHMPSICELVDCMVVTASHGEGIPMARVLLFASNAAHDVVTCADVTVGCLATESTYIINEVAIAVRGLELESSQLPLVDSDHTPNLAAFLKIGKISVHTFYNNLNDLPMLATGLFDGIAVYKTSKEDAVLDTFLVTDARATAGARPRRGVIDIVGEYIRTYLNPREGRCPYTPAATLVFPGIDESLGTMGRIRPTEFLTWPKTSVYTRFPGQFVIDCSKLASTNTYDTLTALDVSMLARLPTAAPAIETDYVSSLCTHVHAVARAFHVQASFVTSAAAIAHLLRVPLDTTARNSHLEYAHAAWLRTTHEHNARVRMKYVNAPVHAQCCIVDRGDLDARDVTHNGKLEKLFLQASNFTYFPSQTLMRIQTAIAQRKGNKRGSDGTGAPSAKRPCLGGETDDADAALVMHLNLGLWSPLAKRVCVDSTERVRGLSKARKACPTIRDVGRQPTAGVVVYYSIDRRRAFPRVCINTAAGLHTLRTEVPDPEKWIPLNVILPTNEPFVVFAPGRRSDADPCGPFSMEAQLSLLLENVGTSLSALVAGRDVTTNQVAALLEHVRGQLKTVSTSLFGGAGRSPFEYLRDYVHTEVPNSSELSELATVTGSLLKDIVTADTSASLWNLLAKLGISGIGSNPFDPLKQQGKTVPGGLAKHGVLGAWIRRFTVDGAEWAMHIYDHKSVDKVTEIIRGIIERECGTGGVRGEVAYKFEQLETLISFAKGYKDSALLIGRPKATATGKRRAVKIIPGPDKLMTLPRFVRRLAYIFAKGDHGLTDMVTMVRGMLRALEYNMLPLGELSFHINNSSRRYVKYLDPAGKSVDVPTEEALLGEAVIDIKYYQAQLLSRLPVLSDEAKSSLLFKGAMDEYLNPDPTKTQTCNFLIESFPFEKAYARLVGIHIHNMSTATAVIPTVRDVLAACWAAQWAWLKPFVPAECTCATDCGPLGCGACAYHGLAPDPVIGSLNRAQYDKVLPRRVIARDIAPHKPRPGVSYSGQTMIVPVGSV